jgi:hypothetical protein
VPLIKEEPSSDDEADPLSLNTSPRNVKVGYVKKFTSGLYNMRILGPTMCQVRTFTVLVSVP